MPVQPERQTPIVLLLAATLGALVAMLGMTVGNIRVPHAAVMAALMPLIVWRLARAWRRVDRTALRAAETLGVGRWRRWTRLALPGVARALVIDILVASVIAAATALLLAVSLCGVSAYTRAP